MSHWNFSQPYRLMSAQTACGVEIVLKDAAAMYAVLPALWGELNRWNERMACPFEDCSLELAAMNLQEERRRVVRWGLFLRIAAQKDFDAAALQEAAEELKKLLADWLRAHRIDFMDDSGDAAVLYHFPCWDAGTANQFYIGSFAKKGTKTTALQRPLVCYKELQPENSAMLLPEIMQLLTRNQGCGLSFEMHSLPEEVCRNVGKIQAEDQDCDAWLKKISGRKAVSARLLVWGSKEYTDDFERVFERHNLTLEYKALKFADELAHYMVFDPWKCTEYLNNSGTKLGDAQYALTFDELLRLFGVGVAAEGDENRFAVLRQSAPAVPHEEPMVPADNESGETAEMLIQVLDRTALLLNEVKQARAENREGHKQVFDLVKQMNEKFDQHQQKIEQRLETGAGAAELAAELDRLVPQGLTIAFTDEELQWLGVQNEDELMTKLHMEEDVIRLMKTAFSVARAGMQLDADNGALMPFTFPIGALFEHLMRLYFQPSLYNHTPRGQNATQDPSYDIKASFLDGTYDEQLAAYANHAWIGGQKRWEYYWKVWLNIFKAIRFSRNKAHVHLGAVEMEELKNLYSVMLHSGIEPKKKMLEYADNHPLKNDPLTICVQNAVKEMKKSPFAYKQSAIQFLLMCRDAEWK